MPSYSFQNCLFASLDGNFKLQNGLWSAASTSLGSGWAYFVAAAMYKAFVDSQGLQTEVFCGLHVTCVATDHRLGPRCRPVAVYLQLTMQTQKSQQGYVQPVSSCAAVPGMAWYFLRGRRCCCASFTFSSRNHSYSLIPFISLRA